MFEVIKMLVPDLSPAIVLLDFEKAAMSAASFFFPGAEIKGCYFHLSQSLLREVKNVGLQKLYDTEIDTKLKIKSLAALTFVPVNDVKTLFYQLAATYPNEDRFNQILEYFYSTYIEIPGGRNPMFPTSVWNHMASALNSCPKTTNCCEGFHNSLNSLFNYSHPGLWILFEGLKKDVGNNCITIPGT